MAKMCAICGKKGQRGNFVSHSKQRTKRTFKVNLHSYRMKTESTWKKVKLCTTCLRTVKRLTEVLVLQTEILGKKKAILNPVMANVNVGIPEVKEEKIEMKKEEKKPKSKGNDDIDLAREIMSESLQKEPKSTKKKQSVKA